MKQHTDYVAGKIREVAYLASKTFVAPGQRDAAGKLPAAPYVVIYPAEGTDTADRFVGPRITQHPRFTIHIVGDDYDGVAEAAAAIKVKFVVGGVGVQPVVSGERSRNVAFESPQPIQVDYDRNPALVYATAEISWDADPT